MRRGKRKLLWIVGVLGVLVAIAVVPTVWMKPWSAEHYYMRVFLRFSFRHPMLLTSLGMLDHTPLDHYSDKLDDLSVAAAEREAKFVDQELDMLRKYDRDKMTPAGKLSRDVLEWFLVNQQEGNRFLFHDYPVNQLFGVQSELPSFMMNTHPLKRVGDAENYVKRVSKMGVALDQVIEGLKLREQRGVVPPRFVIERVLDQMRGFVGTPPRENPLFTTFTTKADSIAKLDPAKRQALEGRLETALRDQVYPAYQRLIAHHEHALTVATEDDGVWKLPDGDAYYDRCLRSHTTTNLPADSIHNLGLSEVARLHEDMKRILERNGYRTTDLPAAINQAMEDPRWAFAAGDSGREQILARYRAILEEADKKIADQFDVRPKARMEVKRVPPFKEATSAGAYYQPASIGGARPGTFYANLRDPAETRRPEMRTLAYHEGIPGHHFQIGIQQEIKGVPFFRNVIPFTAYAEGWALYSERVAYEAGFHQDAYDSLGALQAELFRAVRLVVDTGIHRKRWNRQQAIDYMRANTGIVESKVVSEIERYIVNPGQACAYKVGQLKILELRARARAALGPRFDIRRFHRVTLENGSLPMSLLERVVNDWVQDELKRPAAADRG